MTGFGFEGLGGHGHGERQRQCTDDGSPLVKQVDRGITIDVCPRCGQVVLDHGELQQIIAQVASMPGFQAPVSHGETYAYGRRRGRHGDYHHHTSSPHI